MYTELKKCVFVTFPFKILCLNLTKYSTTPPFKLNFAKSDLVHFTLLEHNLLDWKAARAGRGAGEQLEGAGGGGQQQEEGAGGAAPQQILSLHI